MAQPSEPAPNAVNGHRTSVSAWLDRVRARRREVGNRYTIKLVWLRLVPLSLFHFEHYFIYGLDLRAWKGGDGGVEAARWARPGDTNELLRIGMQPDQVKDLTDVRYRAGVIEREGRIVAYNWCHTGTTAPWPWMRFSLGPGDVWSFRGWTEPALRGHGLFPQVKGFMAQAYKDQGFVRMVSMIEALNRNQQKANASLGGRPIGRLFMLRFLRLTLVGMDGRFRFGWWSAKRPFTLAFDRIGNT